MIVNSCQPLTKEIFTDKEANYIDERKSHADRRHLQIFLFVLSDENNDGEISAQSVADEQRAEYNPPGGSQHSMVFESQQHREHE